MGRKNRPYLAMADAYNRFVQTPIASMFDCPLTSGENYRETQLPDDDLLCDLFRATYETKITFENGDTFTIDGRLGNISHLTVGEKNYIGFPKEWEKRDLDRCRDILQAIIDLESV